MVILALEIEYKSYKEQRRDKIFIYSLLEDFVDYYGFVFNGVVWMLGRHQYYAKPNWIETEKKFCDKEDDILRKAEETRSQAIRTNAVLDDEVNAAIIEAHTHDFLRMNSRVLREEEWLWLDRKV